VKKTIKGKMSAASPRDQLKLKERIFTEKNEWLPRREKKDGLRAREPKRSRHGLVLLGMREKEV